MKKIAIFVEGQTEQIFLLELIKNIAGKREITFEIKFQKGGSLHSNQLILASNAEYYILIVNCCTDGQVKSQINDQIKSLGENGYNFIIGLRDAYPDFTLQNINLAWKYINKGLINHDTVKVSMNLAIMELESWFIEERTHFTKIDPILTNQKIKEEKGFDLENTAAESYENPAGVLHEIYSIAGKSYKKRKKQVNRTVNNLCFETMYTEVKDRSSSFRNFIQNIENAMFVT